MGLLRRDGFLKAVAMVTLTALYFALVAGRAVILIGDSHVVAKLMGIALLVLPAIGAWWLIQEWRLGAVVQRMADALAERGELPAHETVPGRRPRLSEDERQRMFAEARAQVEADPASWSAWFRVGFAYDAAGDRSQARRSLRHAGDLFAAERRGS